MSVSRSNVQVSEHGYTRAAERLNLSRETTDKMVRRALDSGLRRKHIAGGLARWMDVQNKPHEGYMVLFMESAWCFRGTALTTVYRLPQEVLPLFRKQWQRHAGRRGPRSRRDDD